MTTPPLEEPSMAVAAPPSSLLKAACRVLFIVALLVSRPAFTPFCRYIAFFMVSRTSWTSPPNFLVPQVSSKLGSPGHPQELCIGLAPLLICRELVLKLHHGVVCALVLEHIKLSLGASEPTNQPTAASFWAPLAI